jgi:Fic family protein
MDETIQLNPRQKTIVNTLAQSSELTREQIAEKLSALYPVSKATLARDLSQLVTKKYIQAVGEGPSRTYIAASQHPLLKYVDLGQYFAVEPDQRSGISAQFQSEVFRKLPGLIGLAEQCELNELFRSFEKSTAVLDETIRQKELERFMIELSWKSSKIEGNTYTLLETERLIKEKHEAEGRSKHEAEMILNHKDAFQITVKDRAHFRHISLSLVMELHNVLTKNLSIGSGIRKHAVGITGTTYRPLDTEWQIKEALEELIHLINATTNPLEKALLIVGMIAYIQPFADGNKRTARMLANAILLAHDYFPLSYRSIDENEYKSAVIVFYETNNLHHLKRLFLEQYRFALKTYFV